MLVQLFGAHAPSVRAPIQRETRVLSPEPGLCRHVVEPGPPRRGAATSPVPPGSPWWAAEAAELAERAGLHARAQRRSHGRRSAANRTPRTPQCFPAEPPGRLRPSPASPRPTSQRPPPGCGKAIGGAPAEPLRRGRPPACAAQLSDSTSPPRSRAWKRIRSPGRPAVDARSRPGARRAVPARLSPYSDLFSPPRRRGGPSWSRRC